LKALIIENSGHENIKIEILLNQRKEKVPEYE